MPDQMLLRQMFDTLAAQFAERGARWAANLRIAELVKRRSGAPNKDRQTLGPDAANIAHLACLAVPATATVAVFFGLGFSLIGNPSERGLAYPKEASPSVETESRRSDLVTSWDANGTMFTAPAASMVTPRPPEVHDVSPPAAKDQALGSPPASAGGAATANATPDASRSEELQASQSNSDQETLATPIRTSHAKRARSNRYRYAYARTHWAGTARPEAIGRPPSVNGPEKALRWIVHTATDFFAALAPPPPPPAAAARTRLARHQ